MNATKERPIIFSAEMVRAIIDGRKKMTRRVVAFNHSAVSRVEFRDGFWRAIRRYVDDDGGILLNFVHGRPGDRLWVREAFHKQQGEAPIIYAADHPDCKAPKTSPIHMPRRLSRLTLEITSVRVERVQEISEADAVAEGFALNGCGGEGPVNTFHRTWDKINGKRHPWESNPWVWAISFRVVT